MEYLSLSAKPDPRWMTIDSTTQLPTNSTQITEGGMYRFEAYVGYQFGIIVSDDPITVSPNWNNSTFALRGDYENGMYQYIAPGQYIRAGSSGGTYVKMR